MLECGGSFSPRYRPGFAVSRKKISTRLPGRGKFRTSTKRFQSSTMRLRAPIDQAIGLTTRIGGYPAQGPDPITRYLEGRDPAAFLVGVDQAEELVRL